MTLLEVQGLSVRYGASRAVDAVSLRIPPGGALGLVGESGSGKSTVAGAILDLMGPGAVQDGGRILFQGADLAGMAAARRRALLGSGIGAVFQDPFTSLTPTMPVGRQIAEPLMRHRGVGRRAAAARVHELLGELGVDRAGEFAAAYPHELSGGMKQRALIAAAVICEPQLIVLDEPTTALDVTVEAQILDLLAGLRASRGVAMLFISHNLAVVRAVCDEVAVLYGGRLMEHGAAGAVLDRPRHPYTRGLVGALPRAGAARRRLTPIPGEVAQGPPPPGCVFAPRCALAEPRCGEPVALVDGVRCWKAGAHVSAGFDPIGAKLSGSACFSPPFQGGAGGGLPPPARRFPRHDKPTPNPSLNSGRGGSPLNLAPMGLDPAIHAVPPAPAAESGATHAPCPERRPGVDPRIKSGDDVFEAPVLVRATALRRSFATRGAGWFRRARRVAAVDGVDLAIREGEVLGLVGESGSGKSTLGRLLLRLEAADAGEVAFDGVPLRRLGGPAMKAWRRQAQIVFQNPGSSLNPRRTVRRILGRPLTLCGAGAAERERGVLDMLDQVRLPRAYADRHPHQLSGGEKQRVSIARALATKPRFLVLDEPVSALDVSVQAAVLNLLLDLRAARGLTYLFISHDLAVVATMSDRIAVMFAGAVVEIGPADQVLGAPGHPYTAVLLASVPGHGGARPAPRSPSRDVGPGGGAGCRFQSRCPATLGALCETAPPPVQPAGPGHHYACHIPGRGVAA